MPPTTTNTRDEASSRIIIEAMPKVELHAHLNGCIRPSTLQDLAKERNVSLSSLHHHHHDPDGETAGAGSTKSMMYNSRPRSLKDCFDIFAEIPKCVDNKASLHRITQEALQDFADCHVVYLELRSTPKNMKDLTKREYCELILETMLNFEEKQQSDDDDESSHTMRRLPMTCRFIIAADRSSTITEAMDHVDLAIALREKYPDHVVGVDLGGNPCKNHFREFRPAFEKARAAGLKVTIHCGEVPCDPDKQPTAYDEVLNIFDFAPDRLGHALLLPPSLQERLQTLQIPVESCPTSNILTCELHKHTENGDLVEGLSQHPQLKAWIENNHPVTIGTDDPGIFDTSQSKELLLVHHTFQISPDQLKHMILQSMDFSFCNEETRKLVKDRISNWKFVRST